MNQVHKETLQSVENALANRASLDIEIFGMEGIPDDIVQTHKQRVLQQFYAEQAERLAATGNPPQGSGQSHHPKKPKLETEQELKQRVAEWLAKKASGEMGRDAMQVDQPSIMGVVSPGTTQSPTPLRVWSKPEWQVSAELLTAEQGTQGYPPPQQYPTAFNYPPGQQPPYHQAYPPQYPGQSMSPPSGQPFQPPYSAAPGLPPHPAYNTPNQMPMASTRNGVDPQLAASVDDLIASVAKDAQAASAPKEATKEKKSKKNKDKDNIRLVYPDNEISVEEKMAQLRGLAVYVKP